MPVYLRKYYFKKLIGIKKEESKQLEKNNKKIKNTPTSNIPHQFRR
jgi:hypothetical protein